MLVITPAMATLNSDEKALNDDVRAECKPSPSSNWYQPDDDFGTCFADDPCESKDENMKSFCVSFGSQVTDKMKTELGTAYCDGSFVKTKDTSYRIVYKCSDNRRIALGHQGNTSSKDIDKPHRRIGFYCAGFGGEWELNYEKVSNESWFRSACKKLTQEECKKMETMISGMSDVPNGKVKYEKGICTIWGVTETL